MTKIAQLQATRLANVAPHREILRAKVRAAKKAGQDTSFFEGVIDKLNEREMRLKADLKRMGFVTADFARLAGKGKATPAKTTKTSAKAPEKKVRAKKAA